MHRACILAHVFSHLLLQFSFFFLVLQALGHPTLPSPVFWYLDLIPLFQLALHISCHVLIGHAVHRCFMQQKMFVDSFACYTIPRIHCSDVLFLVQSLTKREVNLNREIGKRNLSQVGNIN